jgi:hypothetical protein
MCNVSLQLNVILVSSEHSFPFKLLDHRLEFSMSNFNKFIFVGEVSPKDMYQLLTCEWGVGERLAETLIDHYGGNIYDVYQALLQLSADRESFYTVDAIISNQVIRCLKWKGNQDGDHEKMVEALRQLAVTGFCPVDGFDDPIANVISANNIGGLVNKGAVIIGLPVEVWKSTECRHGIVPSKQSVRLAIAEQLNRVITK